MIHDLVFVYGTLLSGTDSRMHHWLAGHADRVGEGVFQGRLYQLGRYPGAQISRRPSDRVRGEIYRLHQPRKALAQLDSYEDYDPARPSASEYIRVLRAVRSEGGGRLTCWVYIYNRNTERLPRIASGDFLKVAGLDDAIRAMESGKRAQWARTGD